MSVPPLDCEMFKDRDLALVKSLALEAFNKYIFKKNEWTFLCLENRNWINISLSLTLKQNLLEICELSGL